MFCVSIQSGDYRDVPFPLTPTAKFYTLAHVRKYLKQRKDKKAGEYVLIWAEGASTLLDIVKE